MLDTDLTCPPLCEAILAFLPEGCLYISCRILRNRNGQEKIYTSNAVKLHDADNSFLSVTRWTIIMAENKTSRGCSWLFRYVVRQTEENSIDSPDK